MPIYHWYTYSVGTAYDGNLELVQEVGNTNVSYYDYYIGGSGHRQCFAFSAYSINTSNGQITATSKVVATYLYTGSIESSLGSCYYINPETCNTSKDSEIGNQIYHADSLTSNGRASNVKLYKAAQVQVQGSYTGEITSTSASAYPTNGASGSVWYVKTSTVTYQKGSFIDTVTSRVDTAYPANGYQDGYWYVLA